MEPLRGGALASPPPQVKKALAAYPDTSAALRMGAALRPGPTGSLARPLRHGIVEPGIWENAAAASAATVNSLTAKEAARSSTRLGRSIRSASACPAPPAAIASPARPALPIPELFGMYNAASMFDTRKGTSGWYKAQYLSSGHGADSCIRCGECLAKCPQGIAIPDRLEEAHAYLTGIGRAMDDSLRSTLEFEIHGYDCGYGGPLRAFALVNFLQEAAGENATRLGFGMEDLHAKGWTWMLSRLDLRADELPRDGERVLVRTWPAGTRRLFALRDIEMLGPDGRRLVRAVYAYLIVDIAARRLLRPESVFGPSPPASGRSPSRARLRLRRTRGRRVEFRLRATRPGPAPGPQRPRQQRPFGELARRRGGRGRVAPLRPQGGVPGRGLGRRRTRSDARRR